jgi:hypothetical protein
MNKPFNPASYVGLRNYQLRMSSGSRTPLKPTARIAGTPEIRGNAIMECENASIHGRSASR